MADVNLVDSDALKWAQDGANVTGRPERLDDTTNMVTAAEIRDHIDNHPSGASSGASPTEVTEVSVSRSLTNDDADNILLCSSTLTLTVPDNLNDNLVVMVLVTSGVVAIETSGTAGIDGGDFTLDATEGQDSATLVHQSGGTWYAQRSAPPAAPKSQAITVSTSRTLQSADDGAVAYLADNAEVDFGDGIPATWSVDVIRDGGTGGKITRSTGHELFGPGGDAAAFAITEHHGIARIISRGNNAFNVSGPVEATTGSTTQDSLDVRTAADAWGRTANSGNPSWNSNDGYIFVTSGNETWTAHIFSIAIPQGATILSAAFTPYENENGADWSDIQNITMGAEQADNPTLVTSGDYQTRVVNTGNTVVWNPVGGIGIIDNGQPIPGADITPVVQQIVNRQNHESGHNIQILTVAPATNSRSWRDNTDGTALTRPRLEVDFEY